MEPLLQSQRVDERLLIGLDRPDDAAVYQVHEDLALVFTADFITPVVDDAYTYGAIAAINSLSDVYAMGGRPVLALNLVGFPKDMPKQIATEIMRGGFERVQEAGALVVGGHTVEDEEPKFGLAVVGFVHPKHILRKGAAMPGDVILLTKSIGTGLLAKCGKHAVIAKEHLETASRSMSKSNRVASEIAVRHGVLAATDVTGFALLGHLMEMATLAQVGIELSYKSIPILPGALAQARDGSYWPTKTWENMEHFGESIEFASSLAAYQQSLLFSPETSGGLILTVPSEKVDAIMADFKAQGESAQVIGRVVSGRGFVVTE
ncbi:selenide, water dikinase SelD [Sulfoacidibacillus thermotolerans]|uniref:Selenide, water dikinase SelD n=1 Tax=Sulfoacidibacillus thermotolerans TaxID=1765684 RepID=A0A2U3DB21_SULT2|nr:selenide, water dikinase SelD [Sulfoacidibacillus thermotolerans]